MQSKTLLTVCIALVAILAIVSGSLWLDVRSARQRIDDLQNQIPQTKVADAKSAQVETPPATVSAPPAPPAAVQPSESRPPPPPPAPRAEPVIVPAPAPERPLGLPTLTRPLAGNNAEERRADAIVQSDLAATARVARWSTSLNLTPEQRQALDAIAIAELRKETDESLELASRSAPTDAASVARIKEDTINRQNETNLRILRAIAPQLKDEQTRALRTIFDNGHASRMAALRAEREQAASPGR